MCCFELSACISTWLCRMYGEHCASSSPSQRPASNPYGSPGRCRSLYSSQEIPAAYPRRSEWDSRPSTAATSNHGISHRPMSSAGQMAPSACSPAHTHSARGVTAGERPSNYTERRVKNSAQVTATISQSWQTTDFSCELPREAVFICILG